LSSGVDCLLLFASSRRSANTFSTDLLTLQDFLAFKQAEAIPFERLFIVAPYDLLVLMLVVVMGALGGMVRLLRD
jgi:hypothetical protein